MESSKEQERYMFMPKGITPVVATILLLMITISITGVSFVFMQRATQTATQAGEEQLGQQTGQIGSVFSIEGADKNIVYIKNMGARSLNASSLNFYVSNVLVESNSAIIAPGTTGAVALNDSKLAMLPDPAELKVTSASFSDKITADFYGKYTIAYWKFDEGSENIAYDSSGNGNNGVYSGETFNDGTINGATQADGKYGKALSFDGNDYVDAGNGVGLNPTTAVTVEGWLKTASTGSSNVIFSKYGASGSGIGYMLVVNGDNVAPHKITFYECGWHSSTRVIDDGAWHFVTAAFDGSIVKIYIDGILDYSSAACNNLNNPDATGSIGGPNNKGWGSYFNGIIDEVRIYNKALTQQEIQQDMNSSYPVNRTASSYSFENGAKDTHNWIKGISGSALSFDNVNDYVDLGIKSFKFSSSDSFTIEASVLEGQSTGGIVELAYACTNGFVNLGGGRASLSIRDDNGILSSSDIAPVSIRDGMWHRVVGIRDAANRKLFIYVDGVLKNNGNDATTTNLYSATTANYIGSHYPCGGPRGYFSGTIDEVRILNVARSMATG